MSAALFLMAFLWTLIGVCAALLVVAEAKVARPWHLRDAALLLLLAFVGVATRGQTWEWVGWLPMSVASLLTYRSARRASDRAHAVRMFGRPASCSVR